MAAMNMLLPFIGDRAWRRPGVPRMFERLAKRFLGDADMLAKVPNGHLHLLAPQRMFLITTSRAVLAGEDLGSPVRSQENPRIGPWRLPALPVFAMGRGFFEVSTGATTRPTGWWRGWANEGSAESTRRLHGLLRRSPWRGSIAFPEGPSATPP
jgi:hypothetical protein